MYPNAYSGSGSIHECVECGARVESPSTTVCANCSGELLNLSVPRDL